MKKKRLFYLTISVILLLIIVLYVIFRDKSYQTKYEIDNYQIEETFDESSGSYTFKSKYESNDIRIVVFGNKISQKKLISSVDLYEDGDYRCVLLKSKVLKTYPVCFDGESYISYSLLNMSDDFFKLQEVDQRQKEFENISVKASFDETITIWNHFGFNHIDGDKMTDISLFKSETYADPYSFMIGEYVVIPNYDEKYEFSKFYVLNIKSGKTNTIDLEQPISYNYYLLGTYKNKGYLVDRKEKREYEIDPYRNEIELVSKNGIGTIYDNGWTEISVVKLANNDYTFNNFEPMSYYLKDQKMYMVFYKSSNDIMISKRNVDRVVSTSASTVYYISKDRLYRYTPYEGETEIFQYSELEFNKNISIYIH